MTQSYPRGMAHKMPTCSHGFNFTLERKMWGSLYRPPTRACADCAHEEAFRELAEEADFNAFLERLAARNAAANAATSCAHAPGPCEPPPPGDDNYEEFAVWDERHEACPWRKKNMP